MPHTFYITISSFDGCEKYRVIQAQRMGLWTNLLHELDPAEVEVVWSARGEYLVAHVLAGNVINDKIPKAHGD